MPIFQDDLSRHGPSRSPTPPKPFTYVAGSTDGPLGRRFSDERIGRESCGGLLDGLPGIPHARDAGQLPQDVLSRVDLVERLRRGQTTSQRSKPHSLFDDLENRLVLCKPGSELLKSSPISPSADLKGSLASLPVDRDTYLAGRTIERPRSALHSGDFTQESSNSCREFSQNVSSIDASPLLKPIQPAWLATSPPRDFSLPQRDSRFQSASGPTHSQGPRSRAPSLSSSIASSFVFKAPTSPLVHSESNDDLDFSSGLTPINISASSKSSRRHTFQSTDFLQSTTPLSSSGFHRSIPYARREGTHPYQAHQPRRSVTSTHGTLFETSPHLPRSRRPSFTSDGSPLQLTSMVGSYEESILRGRMSTTPSRPLDFVAQIGVLGLGKCKSSLRCPAHVIIPFPAVFYSYDTTAHGRTGLSEDGPSPYVGQIDLENGLPNPDEGPRRKNHIGSEVGQYKDRELLDSVAVTPLSDREIRRAQKQKRRSPSPRTPPGGSYRIPEKGQLQIIIKNPNKTAVKLFLVPYDLAGMEPGTKTFIRQRSYSGGPIIDGPAMKITDTTKDRQTLRYLIHLHICCPSRGRFYLYKSIRVVFANRVPDGKERLRNEISLPEPRFSTYKPGRESHITSGVGASLAAEKAFRRRSLGHPLGSRQNNYASPNYAPESLHADIGDGQSFSCIGLSTTPVEPIPFSLYGHRPTVLREDDGLTGIQSPSSSKSSRPTTSQDSVMADSWHSNSTGLGAYDKLSKGDVGYGGNVFAGLHNGQRAAAEGLLALKLKELGVRRSSPDPSGSV